VLWYWLFAGPALVLAALVLGGERKRAAYVAWRLSEAPEYLPPLLRGHGGVGDRLGQRLPLG
jgi:hypothetical protein